MVQAKPITVQVKDCPEKDSPKGRFQLALEKESDNVEKWDICSRKEDWLLKNNGFAGVF